MKEKIILMLVVFIFLMVMGMFGCITHFVEGTFVYDFCYKKAVEKTIYEVLKKEGIVKNEKNNQGVIQ